MESIKPMKVQIDRIGKLVINGKTRMCPYSQHSCGDDCALFTVEDNCVRLCHRIYALYNPDTVVAYKDNSNSEEE